MSISIPKRPRGRPSEGLMRPAHKPRQKEQLPNGMPVHGRNSDGVPICNSRLAGQPEEIRCQVPVQFLSPNNGRCVVHGGKAPAGVDSPLYINGNATSRYKGAFHSEEDWERFLQRVRDPDLLSLREDIAYTDLELGKIVEEWGRLGKPTLAAMQADLGNLCQQLAEEDVSLKSLQAAEKLLDRINAAAIERERATTIERKQVHRRKLVLAETQRLAAGMRSITADRFLALIIDLRSAARECISLPEDRRRFIRYLEKLIGSPTEQQMKDANWDANEVEDS